jgi:hypothetical protein
MIEGGKDIYFAPDFAEKMKCTLHDENLPAIM